MHSIDCKASSPLDFDAVIAAIAERYPGTRITEADWYAERRAKEVAICEHFGRPVPNPSLDSLDRVWVEIGLQRAFEVPVRDGLKLYARLDKTGGYFFHGACKPHELYVLPMEILRPFDEQEVLPLIEILKRFRLTLRYSGESGGRG